MRRSANDWLTRPLSTLLKTLLVCGSLAVLSTGPALATAAAAPQDPKEEVAEQKPVKPPELKPAAVRSPELVCQRPSTVVCEDFENQRKSGWSDYKDNAFNVKDDEALSGKRSLRQRYDRGQVVAGWLGWYFGDHPEGGLRGGEKFEEVYFRFYHKFSKDWPDRFPPRIARMRSHFVDGGLRFAWQEQLNVSARMEGGTPLSNPISSLAEPDGAVYLGDANLRWLGREPLDLRFAERKGEWVAIEMRVKLNTPGKNDGRITYWADEKVVADRTGLNLRGAYTSTTINAVMLEGYWNGGSPKANLRRWYDNVVISAEPIGCAVFTVRKKELDEQSGWRLQVATRPDEAAVIWDSGTMTGAGFEVDISEAMGPFAEDTPRCLRPSLGYVMRARHAAAEVWSEWSAWQSLF